MWRFLVGLGGFTLVMGLLTIAFGSVIFVSTIGNSLIASGAIGFTGGALIIAMALVLREVERLRQWVEEGGSLRYPAASAGFEADVSPSFPEPEVGDAAMRAVSEAVSSAPEIAAAPEPFVPAPRVREPEPPPEAPLVRPRAVSFADRLRSAPTRAEFSEPHTAEEEPVAERRGRILGRFAEDRSLPAVPRPRSLLERISRSQPAAEALAQPSEPEPPELHGDESASVEAAVPEHPVAGPAPAAPPVEPEAPEAEHQAQRRPGAGRPEPMVLKSGIVGGMAYTLYSDGSIQAELPDGVLRFASLQELRDHVARANPPS